MKRIWLLTPLLLALAAFGQDGAPDNFGPTPPAPDLKPELVDLGRQLFFDVRLSGDASMSCATCHDPEKYYTDGLALSKGYPGALYFRNTPTLINSAEQEVYFWDGRLADLPTLVRDHIAESHFMNADGRLVLERLRQVPEYEAKWRKLFGKEPNYGGILNSVAAFVKSLRSKDVPFDRYLAGEKDALSEAAIRGLAVFKGKGRCIQCHDGPMLTDGAFRNIDVPQNRDIFKSPERHIVFRRFFRTLGLPDYAALRKDPGRFALTKEDSDQGRFRTPSLREAANTAPYMHNGTVATLEDAIDFHDRMGGKAWGLEPLGLTDGEKKDLVEFLKSLSGSKPDLKPPKSPAYKIRKLGEN